MKKRTNEKEVIFTDNNGVERKVSLYTTNGHTEHAECGNAKGTYSWSNRPWQAFSYEQAMLSMIGKLPKEWQETAKKQLIDAQEERNRKETETFIKGFKSNYDKLSDKTKKALAKNPPIIETQSQLEDVNKMIGLMAALGL